MDNDDLMYVHMFQSLQTTTPLTCKHVPEPAENKTTHSSKWTMMYVHMFQSLLTTTPLTCNHVPEPAENHTTYLSALMASLSIGKSS
eukprot:1139587-Pelagomonas_calceolata.AAC.3